MNVKTFIILAAFLGSVFFIYPSQANSSGMRVSAYAGGLTDLSMHTSRLVISANETDTLDNGDHSTNVIPGAGIGYNFIVEPGSMGVLDRLVHEIYIGLDAYYYNTTADGDVLLYGNPQLADLNYRINLQTYTLMLTTEWTSYPLFRDISLFLQAGVGGARNRMKYRDFPKMGIVVSGIELDSNVDINFAYEAGVGAKAELMENVQLSIRYLYSDLGNQGSSTKIKGDGSIGRHLTVKPRAQTWLVGLSYCLT